MPWEGKRVNSSAACKAARAILWGTDLAALQAAWVSEGDPGHRPAASALGWALPSLRAG